MFDELADKPIPVWCCLGGGMCLLETQQQYQDRNDGLRAVETYGA